MYFYISLNISIPQLQHLTPRKRARKSTPSSRRVWTLEEEFTLVDGLKELCVNGWRGDNETFKHGYLMDWNTK
ncbi:hypothetical protein H5410_004655 [Solanum commersonii]|uniref:Uncharacterized protein n=1 Tax=Solanum commersonii TaxID=4109 RepID=A0A9J6B8M8_SOLCO|nr:hypothetical protein H5410_004655 [Solanum commersonii]